MINKDLPNIHFPDIIDDAIQLLAENPKWKPLAGGTDIFVSFRTGRYPITDLVDLSGFPELKGVIEDTDFLIIGALTPHSEYIIHPFIKTNNG